MDNARPRLEFDRFHQVTMSSNGHEMAMTIDCLRVMQSSRTGA
jgi:hypothetical protein